MIPYHGSPLTPESAMVSVFWGKHVMVSFAHPEQLPTIAEICQSFVLDNGAFSAWRSGNPITDWLPFRAWIDEWSSHPSCDWFLIPDVIDGKETENDYLVSEFRKIRGGVPIWHMHESLDRLKRLMDLGFERLALGSSGEYTEVGKKKWWNRMSQAMNVLTDDRGRPMVKLHGLRMLDPAIFSKLPLSSADSTSVARNVGLDSRWRGTYQPPNKTIRGIVLSSRIEAFQSAAEWSDQGRQEDLFTGLFAEEGAS